MRPDGLRRAGSGPGTGRPARGFRGIVLALAVCMASANEFNAAIPQAILSALRLEVTAPWTMLDFDAEVRACGTVGQSRTQQDSGTSDVAREMDGSLYPVVALVLVAFSPRR